MLYEAFKPETETEALTHETEARRRDASRRPRDQGVETEATTLPTSKGRVQGRSAGRGMGEEGNGRERAGQERKEEGEGTPWVSLNCA